MRRSIGPSLLMRAAAVFVFVCTHLNGAAQLYRDLSVDRGGGVLQSCDTSMHVSISTTLLDNYACEFLPVIDPGATTVDDFIWTYYYNGTLQQAYGNPMQLTAPWSEPYPVCLTVDAFDLQAQQPCSTTVCDMITPVADVACTTLVPDFGIASVAGQTITFEDLSTFDGLVEQLFWSFGEGTTIANSTPTHTFTGSGPFEVCLTVVSSAPYYCSATVCQWLYLGPSGVECGVLIEQGYLFIEAGDLVGVLDTSVTSGMFSSIDWDFGDGALAQGNVAVHEYSSPGEFQLCGTLRAWGPLLNDTCVTTLCRTVITQQVGLPERSSAVELSVAPNPCTSGLGVSGMDLSGVAIEVIDALGRSVSSPPMSVGASSAWLDLSGLEPGPYVLYLSAPDRSSAIRFVKE